MDKKVIEQMISEERNFMNGLAKNIHETIRNYAIDNIDGVNYAVKANEDLERNGHALMFPLLGKFEKQLEVLKNIEKQYDCSLSKINFLTSLLKKCE